MAPSFCAGGSRAAIPWRPPRCFGFLLHRLGAGASFRAPRGGRALGRPPRPHWQGPAGRDPGEEVPRSGRGRRAQRPRRLFRGVRRTRPGERRADDERRHLPHLLNDEAARRGRRDDPRRRGQDRAHRSRLQVPAGFRQDAGERPEGGRDGEAHLRHHARGAGHDGAGPAAAHLGARLRRDHGQRAGQGRLRQGRRVPGRLPLRVARHHAGRGSRAALQGAAGASSRRGLGVQPVGRRPRARDGGRGGHPAVGVPRCAPVQAAEDGRCGVLGAEGQDGTPRAAVPDRSGDGQPEPGAGRERRAEERLRWSRPPPSPS